jgi:outer membrane protein
VIGIQHWVLKVLAAMALLAGALPAAQAQQQLKIGVVSVPQLIEESPQAKGAMQALQDEFMPRRREIENQQKELKAREDKLTRDSAVMSEAERSKGEKDLRDGQRELQRRQNEYVEDLNVRRNEELGKLQRTLLQEVQTYAKAQGFDLVVGDGVLYAKDNLNITPAVLGNLQAHSKNAPAAAPAAPKPPAATPPATTPKPAEKKP